VRVKTVDAVSMVDIFKTLNEFIPEVTLDFTEEGLKISGIDASKVVLINVFLPKSYFDEYDVNGEEKVGVNLEDLTDLLSGVTKNDSLAFSGERAARSRLRSRGSTTGSSPYPGFKWRALSCPKRTSSSPSGPS